MRSGYQRARRPQVAKVLLKRFPTWALLLIIVLYTLSVYIIAGREKVVLPDAALPIQLYSNQAGDDLRKTFSTAIMSATSSISCLIYSLTDEEVIQALRNRAEAGVSVTVVCDPVATQDARHKLGPQVVLIPRRQKGLMHNKLLAIDHKQAWLGSANFTRDSLMLHANLVVGIESPLIASQIEEKAKSLIDHKKRRFSRLTVACKEQELIFSFLPDDATMLDTIVQMVESAQKSVKVAMFTFTHPKLVDALVQAHRRGRNVEVVFDHDSSRKTSQIAYKRLKQAQVPVYVSQRTGLLHEKIAILDDETLIMGSANWTKAAFTANDENVCIIHPLTLAQKEKLRTFWTCTLKESDARSGVKRMG